MAGLYGVVGWVGDGGCEEAEGVGADELVEGWAVEDCVVFAEIHGYVSLLN